MFQSYKKYDFVVLEDHAGVTSEVTYSGVMVLDEDDGLVKINFQSKETILNTRSLHFVRAIKVT